MLNRAKGCFLGQIIGDNLGAPVEFMTKAHICKKYPPYGIEDMQDAATLPGQPTDDSEMAIALAASILSNNGNYDASLAKNAYIDWLNSPGVFDVGRTIRNALSGNIISSESQANGALMRVSPLGIWGTCRSRAELHRCAIEDSRITHVNPNCCQVNEIFSSMLAEAISTGLSGEELYRDLFDNPRKYTSMGSYLPEVESWMRAAEGEHWNYDEYSIGWVAYAFHNALYRMLYAPDFELGVLDSVNEGGDSDTNSAVCGALLGAIYGLDAIPGKWISAVMNCRPSAENGAHLPRPERFWPWQAMSMAEKLLFS